MSNVGKKKECRLTTALLHDQNEYRTNCLDVHKGDYERRLHGYILGVLLHFKDEQYKSVLDFGSVVVCFISVLAGIFLCAVD